MDRLRGVYRHFRAGAVFHPLSIYSLFKLLARIRPLFSRFSCPIRSTSLEYGHDTEDTSTARRSKRHADHKSIVMTDPKSLTLLLNSCHHLSFTGLNEPQL